MVYVLWVGQNAISTFLAGLKRLVWIFIYKGGEALIQLGLLQSTIKFICLVCCLVGSFVALPAYAAKCLYISSYHHGYEWNDGLERGIENALQGKCTLDKFYMDTKRNKSEPFGQEMALEAKAYIEASKPDILLVADDNASRYLIQPYYKDHVIPVVFCGINYSVKSYGYPYSNATGMIEISPIRPLLKYTKSIQKDLKLGVYLASDVISQHKEFELNQKVYASQGITLLPMFVSDMNEWLEAYSDAQKQVDFIIVGNNGGIEGWDDQLATAQALKKGKLLSVSNYEWMNRYALLTVSKLAEEQGEWMAQVAVAVLGGENISEIPIVVNRRWQVYVNVSLMGKNQVKVPQKVMVKAIRVSL